MSIEFATSKNSRLLQFPYSILIRGEEILFCYRFAHKGIKTKIMEIMKNIEKTQV